jgi:nucleotide-binding universal stress UspA family protein
MFTRILLATDGSPRSERSLQVALEVAQKYQAQVVIAHAYPYVSDLLGTPVYDAMLSHRVGKGNEILDRAAQPFEQAGLTVKRELLEGPAAQSILKVAETRECDLIVVGARGLSELGGLLLGSVSHTVISHATCPVLVAR